MKNPNEFFDNYPKDKAIFNFDNLKAARPLYAIIPYEAEMEFHRIATTLSLNGNLQKKYQLMDDLARRLDLTLLARGTNRAVYTVNFDSSIVIKIGYDRAGISDSAREYENQKYLKPFCTKCFEVSPTGTIGMFERVTPVKHYEEFMSMGEEIFDMLYTKILGKYVMADIGCSQYMNYGFREGFGPVILDYPYLYELDESKLTCRNVIAGTGAICGGKIDYDDEFEHLICDRCGKQYSARDLARELQHQKDRDLFKGLLQEETTMKIKGYGNNASFDSQKGGKVQNTTVIPASTEKDTIEAEVVEVTTTEVVSNDQLTPGTTIPKEYFDRIVKDAYLQGMIDGKAKAEEQQGQRIFNQQASQQPAQQTQPVQQAPVAQEAKPQQEKKTVLIPPPTSTQPRQETPKVEVQVVPTTQEKPQEKSVTIKPSEYRQYRDPAPRGKGAGSGYVGWQTPRRTGKPPIITKKNRQPEQQQPKPAPQTPVTPPKPRQPVQQNERVFQNPKSAPQIPVTPPKPRQPYQPKQPLPPQQYAPKPPETNQQSSRNNLASQPRPEQPKVTMSKENYDYLFVDSITKHVMFFCMDNAERRDDVIYELAYITALYRLELDQTASMMIPRKSITDVVRKIVDLIEDKMEAMGVIIEYEYDDDDRYSNNNPYEGGNVVLEDDTAIGTAVPISDDQEDRLSYEDRLRDNGISFGEGVVPNPQSEDHVLEEVGTIFNSNEANPNDTSTTDELTQRINSQINMK